MGTGQVHIRRNVWSLDPTQPFASEVTLNDAKAVRVIQQRDRTDPTSRSSQAAIHGTRDPAPPAPLEPVPAQHLVLPALAPHVPVVGLKLSDVNLELDVQLVLGKGRRERTLP